MIPILYKADAVDFSTYGIGALSECTLCEVTEERNGAFECTLKYPVSGILFSELKNERLIKAILGNFRACFRKHFFRKL